MSSSLVNLNANAADRLAQLNQWRMARRRVQLNLRGLLSSLVEHIAQCGETIGAKRETVVPIRAREALSLAPDVGEPVDETSSEAAYWRACQDCVGRMASLGMALKDRHKHMFEINRAMAHRASRDIDHLYEMVIKIHDRYEAVSRNGEAN